MEGERKGMGTSTMKETAGQLLDFVPVCKNMAALATRYVRGSHVQPCDTFAFLHIFYIFALFCSSPSKFKLDRLFLKRFWRCWKEANPGLLSTTFLLFVLLVGLSLAGIEGRSNLILALYNRDTHTRPIP